MTGGLFDGQNDRALAPRTRRARISLCPGRHDAPNHSAPKRVGAHGWCRCLTLTEARQERSHPEIRIEHPTDCVLARETSRARFLQADGPRANVRHLTL